MDLERIGPRAVARRWALCPSGWAKRSCSLQNDEPIRRCWCKDSTTKKNGNARTACRWTSKAREVAVQRVHASCCPSSSAIFAFPLAVAVVVILPGLSASISIACDCWFIAREEKRIKWCGLKRLRKISLLSFHSANGALSASFITPCYSRSQPSRPELAPLLRERWRLHPQQPPPSPCYPLRFPLQRALRAPNRAPFHRRPTSQQ